jgi:hypothetical protein
MPALELKVVTCCVGTGDLRRRIKLRRITVLTQDFCRNPRNTSPSRDL